MPEMKLGAQLYTVRQFTQTIEGIAETLRKVKAIGYQAVQVSGFGPVDAKEVAKAVQDEGLTVAATHMAWEAFLNGLDEVIETHKLWRCVHPAIGGLGAEYRGQEGLKRFLGELPPVARRLAAEGMDFSYHNHNHELVRIGDRTWLECLYEQADPAELKAEIDTYWIQAGGGDPADWVRRCAGREPLLHLKDMSVTPDRQQRFAPIGEGNLNWPAILAAARQGGVEWCLVEQDDSYGEDPFGCLEISYRNCKKLGLS